MNTSKKIVRVRLLLVSIFVLGLSVSGYSQSTWVLKPDKDTTVGLDLMIPDFDHITTDGSPQAALYLYSHIPVTDKVSLRLDLPFSRYFNGGGEADIAIGNPYIGVRLGAKNSGVNFDLGVRLPLASETSGALTTGRLVENYKVTPFVPDAYGIVANVHYRYASNSSLIYKIGGGPEIGIPKEGDNELFLRYYGQLLYHINDVTFGGGITGQLIATESDLSFSERSIHDIGVTGSYSFGKVTAGAYVRRALDDNVNTFVNYVVGINLSVSF